MKTCSGGWHCCQYAYFSNSVYLGCNYTGYCDYQLPKDSRGWVTPPKMTLQEPANYHKEIEEMK